MPEQAYILRGKKMTELVEFEDNEYPDQEEKKMGSLNHGIAQANLSALFYNNERF